MIACGAVFLLQINSFFFFLIRGISSMRIQVTSINL
uniref:Uncharacterized protein n=1 Tax=Rhizophora mucronata TaxID=61149 RepID=A0A2P2MAZ6_RHIMU